MCPSPHQLFAKELKFNANFDSCDSTSLFVLFLSVSRARAIQNNLVGLVSIILCHLHTQAVSVRCQRFVKSSQRSFHLAMNFHSARHAATVCLIAGQGPITRGMKLPAITLLGISLILALSLLAVHSHVLVGLHDACTLLRGSLY